MRRFARLAVALSGLLGGCSPQWAGGAAPVITTPPFAERAELDPLERYATTPLGKRVRSKRIRVLMVSVGDIAIYEFEPWRKPPTYTSVLRSYTSFKGKSLEGLDEFMGWVKDAYVYAPGEIDSVRALIHEAVKDVEYFRVDVRHRPDQDQGAVLIYEFVEDGEDRLLESRLIDSRAALAVIHYTDWDGWETPIHETMLAPDYDTTKQGNKLLVTPKKKKW